MGIENLKKVLALVLEAGNVSGKIAHGSGSAWSRMAHLMDLVDELMALPSVEWKKLDDEWKDLSSAEREELKKFVESKFDIPHEKAEVVVEKSMAYALELMVMIDGIVKMVEEARK